MNRKDKNDIRALLNKMHIDSDCVVVNQCDRNEIDSMNYKNYKVTIVCSTDRGLSKSRNLALKHARADIVVIADDDIQYVDGYSKKIIEAYDKINDADIITFKVREDKKYFSHIKKLNKILVHKITSYEITMCLHKIKNIRFNEIFGTGSGYFSHGEENIFLTDCIRKGERIYFYPQNIADLLEDERPSTWFIGYDRRYFIDQGALYYKLSNFFFFFYILQFALRKYKLYKRNFGILTALYYMVKGIGEYKEIIGRDRGPLETPAEFL
jgi:glycosyltransferase involved in cell wall biosynthesis